MGASRGKDLLTVGQEDENEFALRQAPPPNPVSYESAKGFNSQEVVRSS